jgi:HTH-type transcriptional regulator / antitoxin HigA
MDVIHPIRSQKDYKAALRNIEALMDAKPNTVQGDALEVLSVLVDDYERRHFPIDPPTPIDAIHFRMEQSGCNLSDLAPILGGRNRVSEVLRGKRKLTVAMIRNLHAKLGIPAHALLG